MVFIISHDGISQKMSKAQLDQGSADFAKSSFPLLKEIMSIPNDAFFPDDIEKNV